MFPLTQIFTCMHYHQSVQGEDCVLEFHLATIQESESLVREHKNDFSVSPPVQSTSPVH